MTSQRNTKVPWYVTIRRFISCIKLPRHAFVSYSKLFVLINNSATRIIYVSLKRITIIVRINFFMLYYKFIH